MFHFNHNVLLVVIFLHILPSGEIPVTISFSGVRNGESVVRKDLNIPPREADVNGFEVEFPGMCLLPGLRRREAGFGRHLILGKPEAGRMPGVSGSACSLESIPIHATMQGIRGC